MIGGVVGVELEVEREDPLFSHDLAFPQCSTLIHFKALPIVVLWIYRRPCYAQWEAGMATGEGILQQVHRDLQTARETVAVKERELASARMEMADLEGFVRTFERYSDKVDVPASSAERRRNKEWGVPELGTQARKLVDTCIEAIREKGVPIKIGDLLDIVLEKGLTLGGRDQKSNLAGYLSRDPRVESRGRSIGWDIIETEGAASEPSSNNAAPPQDQGGTDGTALTSNPSIDDLLG